MLFGCSTMVKKNVFLLMYYDNTLPFGHSIIVKPCCLRFAVEISCFLLCLGKTISFGSSAIIKLSCLAFTMIIPCYGCDTMERPSFRHLPLKYNCFVLIKPRFYSCTVIIQCYLDTVLL